MLEDAQFQRTREPNPDSYRTGAQIIFVTAFPGVFLENPDRMLSNPPGTGGAE
jgi:hypothetical protein